MMSEPGFRFTPPKLSNIRASLTKSKDSDDPSRTSKYREDSFEERLRIKEELRKARIEEQQKKRELKFKEREEQRLQRLKEKLEKRNSAIIVLNDKIEEREIINMTQSDLDGLPSHWLSWPKQNKRTLGMKISRVLSSSGGPVITSLSEDFMEVELDSESKEFQYISKLLNSNIGSHQGKFGTVHGRDPISFKVKKIHRIQNLELWKRFQFAKSAIKKQNGDDLPNLEGSIYLQDHPCLTPLLDSTANEYYLFHGTKWDVINIVKHKGFDERVGSVTGMYGAGIYFAENSSKSNQYIPCPKCGLGAIFTQGPCECSNSGNYGMLLCRVILGDVHISLQYDAGKYKGDPQKPIRRPPNKPPPKDIELYDSILGESIKNGGDTLNYREFIVYDRYQVYPEYIITFDRIGSTVDFSQNTEDSLQFNECL